MEQNIKTQTQKQSILSCLFFLIIPIIDLVVITLIVRFGLNKIGYIIIFGILCLDFLPTIILFINYLIKRSHSKFIISETRIEISKKSQHKTIKNQDIKKIEFHSYSPDINFLFSWFFLYWGIIKLKNGEKFTFTCLDGFFIKNRLKEMKGVYFDSKKGFPLISE